MTRLFAKLLITDHSSLLTRDALSGTLSANAERGMAHKRRPILGIFAIGLLFFLYRVFTVYTVRSGECRPRDERPSFTEPFPPRTGFPKQTRPLLVMSYNIAGHDELYDGDHIQKIAAVINRAKPDIVALQEVHRGTWQARFRDQLRELEVATGMHGAFGKSYAQWGGAFGDALLTRGDILSAEVHELPSVGEPRVLVESTIRIDNATIDFYVTHLTTWGKYNRSSRREQLLCLARHVKTSGRPYILAGDFNAPPDTPELIEFRKQNVAQLCGETIGDTHPLLHERIDYIWADYGWDVRSARLIAEGPSDHWPVIAELFWNRGAR